MDMKYYCPTVINMCNSISLQRAECRVHGRHDSLKLDVDNQNNKLSGQPTTGKVKAVNIDICPFVDFAALYFVVDTESH